MHNDMDQTAVLVFWKILPNTGDENTINCKKELLRSQSIYRSKSARMSLGKFFRIPYICVIYKVSNKGFTVDLSSELMLITSPVAFVIFPK